MCIRDRGGGHFRRNVLELTDDRRPAALDPNGVGDDDLHVAHETLHLDGRRCRREPGLAKVDDDVAQGDGAHQALRHEPVTAPFGAADDRPDPVSYTQLTMPNSDLDEHTGVA